MSGLRERSVERYVTSNSHTRWGHLATRASLKTGEVAQTIVQKGEINIEELNALPSEPTAILSERQEWQALAYRTLDVVSLFILGTTVASEAESIIRERGFKIRRAFAGGIIAAVSHLAADHFRDKADFTALRREEVEIVKTKWEDARRSEKSA